MFKFTFAVFLCVALLSEPLFGRDEQPTPSPFRAAPPSSNLPLMPGMPTGIGPQSVAPNNIRSPGAQPVPGMPGGPAGVGAQPIPPPINEPSIPRPARTISQQPATSNSAGLISFLDSTAPYVQAFDFLLMIVAGIFCLRARRAPGLTLLAICCFVSAIILLGFFLFGVFHGRGLAPQIAYITARILAPFELLLFAIAIIIVARVNAKN